MESHDGDWAGRGDSGAGSGGSEVGRLRAALRAAANAPSEEERERAARAVDRAAAPLVEQVYPRLSRYCRRLIADAPLLRGRVEADDLVQDVWVKALRYLREPTGDRVASDTHWTNLLYRIAMTLFKDSLDHYGRAADVLVHTVALDAESSPPGGSAGSVPSGGTRGDRLAAGDAWRADRTLLLGDDRHAERLALLFRDPAAFRATSRFPMNRRLARYQAFVLLQLGLYLTEELASDATAAVDAAELRLLRAFVAHLGVPSAWWEAVEPAAIALAATEPGGATLAALLPTVSRVCGVDLKSGNALAVLRYELNASISGSSESG